MKYFIYITVILFACSNALTAQTGTDTIQVSTGWNLIGSLSSGATVEIINTNPPGIIETSLWGFNPDSGYYPADTLNKGEGYWVKVSQNGIILTETITNPCQGQLTVYHDGNTYNTLQIGTQCWLRENLNVGIRIDGIQESSNNGIVEKYCYENNPTNCLIYGGLYQWDEAMQYTILAGSQGICPIGWHIPSIADWQTLSISVNGDGNSIKAVGEGGGAGAGTNMSGFSAFSAGFRNHFGNFQYIDYLTNIWSSTENYLTNARNLELGYNDNQIYLNFIYDKVNGFNVRCIKD